MRVPLRTPPTFVESIMAPLRLTAICAVFLALIAAAGVAPAETFYVSKLGDNSDGLSWAKAFNTVQAALDAIPNDQGGHRIVVRPDTYMEANLSPAHKGAASAYNQLTGDFDGRLGSGATGWVILDAGDPEKGFK